MPSCFLRRCTRLHDCVPVPAAVNQLPAAQPLHKAGHEAYLREAIVEVLEEPCAAEEAGESEDQLLGAKYSLEGALRLKLPLQGQQRGCLGADDGIALLFEEETQVGQDAPVALNRGWVPA